MIFLGDMDLRRNGISLQVSRQSSSFMCLHTLNHSHGWLSVSNGGSGELACCVIIVKACKTSVHEYLSIYLTFVNTPHS